MATRSHGGCWTCKRRRRKCDEARPHCATCQARGLRCEGYATRLRWGSGVASRGRLVGASEPVLEKAPARAKGRTRDLLRRKAGEGEDGVSPFPYGPAPRRWPLLTADPGRCQSSSGGSGRGGERAAGDAGRRVAADTEEARLFDEFMASGHKLLSSARARDAPVRAIVSRHGQPSGALHHICVAFQACVSRAPLGDFLKYYDVALARYRAEIAAAIADPARADADATLHAGLLMCTVGMLQAVPWTYHLSGVSRLLSLRHDLSSLASAHAVDVVALLDLPILVVGRQSPCLGLWQQQRRRRRRSGRLAASADAVDVVTGLPRSLIDLLAGEVAALDEAALRAWSPAGGGDAAQRCLWDAYRLAGMVDARRARREEGMAGGRMEGEVALPSDAVLLGRLVDAVGAVQASEEVVAHNDALYPTFVAALEVVRRPEDRRWRGLVDGWFERQVALDRLNTSRLAWELVGEVRRRALDGDSTSADDVARSWGKEVVLF